MYLRKIHIENYRLLKNVDVNFDRDLTLFVGKNNTGKTSFLMVLTAITPFAYKRSDGVYVVPIGSLAP